MKKRLALKILMIIVSAFLFTGLCAGMPANAEVIVKPQSSAVIPGGKCGDNLTWTLDTDGVLTISGTGEMKNMFGWDRDEDRPWNSLSTYIKYVRIEDGVTSVGESAFRGCTNIREVSLPESLKYIWGWSFRSCRSLETITIPENTEIIGMNAFFDCCVLFELPVLNPECEILDENIIPYDSLQLEETASGECGDNISWSLNSAGILIISGEGEMADYSPETPAPWHEYISEIKRLYVKKGITRAGDYAFDGCEKIIQAELPEGLETIGNHTFSGCSGVKYIFLPESTVSIGEFAFDNTSSALRITVKNPECIIPEDAFSSFKGTIRGISGSTAESYASDKGISFTNIISLAADEPSLTGDVNGDGYVNISDATAVLKIYAERASGQSTAEYSDKELEKADADGDGSITIADATLILKIYAEKSAGM